VEKKPFTSSLIFMSRSLLQKGVLVGGVTPLPLTTTLQYFPSLLVNISFEDDVTVILHCFYCITSIKQILESIMGGISPTEGE
jgi:hypothetical protein